MSVYVCMHACMYVCMCVCVCLYVSMYVCMDGWMDGCIRMDGWMDGCIRMDGWKHACMHVCMYVWSRVPCSRERELGGPYHWGGARDPESGLIYIYIRYIYTYICMYVGTYTW